MLTTKEKLVLTATDGTGAPVEAPRSISFAPPTRLQNIWMVDEKVPLVTVTETVPGALASKVTTPEMALTEM